MSGSGHDLCAPRPSAAEDLAALHELLLGYGDSLEEAVATVQRNLGITPSSRVKTTGTILEKLERYGGSWLKSIQDLAGMRIVGAFDRRGQDAVVAQLVATFADGARPPRVIDRRKEPSHGYRAVHVIVFVRSLPVEIQVRTQLQHEWAELFEKLADEVGRGIRYGEPPERRLEESEREALSPIERRWHDLVYEGSCQTVDVMQRTAEAIATYETLEFRTREDVGLEEVRAAIDLLLGKLSGLLDQIAATKHVADAGL